MYQQIFVEAISKRDGSVYLKPMGKPRRVLLLGEMCCEYIRADKRCYAYLIDGYMVDRPWLAYKLVA